MRNTSSARSVRRIRVPAAGLDGMIFFLTAALSAEDRKPCLFAMVAGAAVVG